MNRTTRRRFLAMAGTGALSLSASEVLAQQPPSQVRRHNTPELKPDTSVGPHVLTFDFPALHIGSALYKEGPTGCTVFFFPKGATAVADIRGGAPATIYTDHLQERSAYVDAICLAGGSSYGLEASTGVAAELLAQRGYSTAWQQIAGVTGAIIFDYRPRDNAIYPDKELGRAALRAAAPGVFPLGARGVGVSATCGKFLLPDYQWELAGQGGAFHRSGPTRIAVFTVVNSFGAILDRQGRVVRGFLDAKTGKRMPVPDLRQQDRAPAQEKGNTTLTVLVTNQKMNPDELRQVARGVHASMARAIQPFHGPNDGDVLFAATTDEVDNPALNSLRLTAMASECAWDAVLRCFTGRS
ncbi:MAG TPA: P1 family peptidase [Myxococcaceae bacterium]|jgi:L-aminopeptidase/D-esterase-like protein